MTKKIQCIEIDVLNSETILVRIIQVVKKRCLPILKLSAEEVNNENIGVIRLWPNADDDKIRLVRPQLEKIVEVIKISNMKECNESLFEFQHHDFVPAY